MDPLLSFLGHFAIGFVIGVLVEGSYTPYLVGGSVASAIEIQQYLKRCSERYAGRCLSEPFLGFKAYKGGYGDTVVDVSAILVGVYFGKAVRGKVKRSFFFRAYWSQKGISSSESSSEFSLLPF